MDTAFVEDAFVEEEEEEAEEEDDVNVGFRESPAPAPSTSAASRDPSLPTPDFTRLLLKIPGEEENLAIHYKGNCSFYSYLLDICLGK